MHPKQILIYDVVIFYWKTTASFLNDFVWVSFDNLKVINIQMYNDDNVWHLTLERIIFSQLNDSKYSLHSLSQALVSVFAT